MSKAKRQERKKGREAAGIARVKKRTNGKVSRTEKRGRQSTRRVNKRESLGKGKISSKLQKKFIKKGYGEIDTEQADTVNELQQLAPAMSDYLDDREIEYDPEDPIEIAAKFTQTNPDIIDPLDDQTYDDAFVNDDDYYSGVEGYENYDWKKAAKGAAMGALGAIGNSASDYVKELQDKKNKGVALTDREKQLLGAVDTGKGAVKSAVVGKITDTLKNIAPFGLILLVLYIVLKK